jgi:hypothetical protein
MGTETRPCLSELLPFLGRTVMLERGQSRLLLGGKECWFLTKRQEFNSGKAPLWPDPSSGPRNHCRSKRIKTFQTIKPSNDSLRYRWTGSTFGTLYRVTVAGSWGCGAWHYYISAFASQRREGYDTRVRHVVKTLGVIVLIHVGMIQLTFLQIRPTKEESLVFR